MMNFEIYSLLRKCLDDGTFTGMDVFQAERACQKFEEAQEARKLKQEIRNTMMKNMMLDVLSKAEKPLCPTEIQFILYRETGKEYPCATVAWYCGHLCWIDKKLTYTKKGSRSYYSIRKEN